MTIEAFRLSPQQARAWAQGGSYPAALGSSSRLELSGALDADRLTGALERLVRKHEILRTTFALHEKSGGAAQFLHPEGVLEIEAVDLRGTAELEGALAELETRRSSAGLPESPRLAATLVQVEDQRWYLLCDLPAPSADHRGLLNLVRELAAAYGDDPAFETESMQYADVAEWQNELLEAEESKPGLEYWRGLDLAAGLAIRIPFQNAPAQAYRPAHVRRLFDDELQSELSSTASRLGSTPENVLLSAWSVLLSRLSSCRAVVVGVGLAGRRLEELADSIGPLQRWVPAPLELAPEITFQAALGIVGAGQKSSERWLECFGWDERENAPDYFPFAFEYHPLAEGSSAAGVTFRLDRARVRAERSLCRLICEASPEGLAITLDHDPSSLSEVTVERLAGQFEALLRYALRNPECAIADLDALSAEERRTLLVEFNETRAEYDRERCAHHWIEEQAERTPDAIAVRFETTSLTYGDLEVRANRLAHHLIERGVGPDVLVALCIERSVEMVVSIVAILKAGGAYVPVDPAYPKDRLAFLLEDTDAPVLVTQSKLAPLFEGIQTTTVFVDRDADAIASQPAQRPETGVAPDHLVYVIYTSGSTGKPKGVVITHRKLVISNTARVNAFGHTPDCFLLLSSFAFDSSVVGIFWTLCAGGTLLLIPEALQKDIARIPKIVAAEKVSHLLTLPSFYQHLVEQAAAQDLQGLHSAIVAGEACPLGMVEKHRKKLPGVGLFSEYGATETTVFSSVFDCIPQTLPIASLGDPIDNAEMYVLDARMNPCPMGVPGEVHFGGEALAVGYWKRPELTAERFVPHTLSGEAGARLYKSGDLARWLECGEMEFLGRIDNQVKIRGFRIELEEIEIALALHPKIKETAVLALTDLSAEKRLVGYLVPEERGAAPTVGEMRDFLAESLPDYMLPGVYVVLDDFPRTPNGKVDRKALPEPGSERPDLENEYQAASSPAEVQLALIWCDILGLAEVGVNDNFFELGGDSILSIQIVSRAKQAGILLTPRLVFENQTVASLAAVAEVDEALLGAGSAQIDQGPVTGEVPLTPVQRWFVELDLPAPAHWNMPVLMRVNRPLEPAALVRALAHLLRHHDTLRLRLTRDEAAPGGWRQECAAPESGEASGSVAAAVVREHVAGLDAAARAAVIARHQASLDLEHGPLTKLVLLDGDEGSQELLWILHHLAADGVSWRILLEDLEALLTQIEAGAQDEEFRLPDKTSSFLSWANGLVAFAEDAQRLQDLEVWRPLTQHALTPLPVDFPGEGRGSESSARKVTVQLNAETTRSLLTEVPRAYNMQIQEVLLTAAVQALCAWTGEQRVLVNLEGHGRDDLIDGVDLSRTVGWFTTDAPVLLAADPDPATALRGVKDAARTTVDQALRFGILRYLSRDPQIAATMARIPHPEVGFNYLGQFDAVLAKDARLAFSPELAPGGHDPSGPRAFLVEIYGMVSGGELIMHFEYSEERHAPATLQGLAQRFLDSLSALVEHCLSPDAGGLSVSDVSEFDWSASDLEAIAGAIQDAQGGGDSDVEAR